MKIRDENYCARDTRRSYNIAYNRRSMICLSNLHNQHSSCQVFKGFILLIHKCLIKNLKFSNFTKYCLWWLSLKFLHDVMFQIDLKSHFWKGWLWRTCNVPGKGSMGPARHCKLWCGWNSMWKWRNASGCNKNDQHDAALRRNPTKILMNFWLCFKKFRWLQLIIMKKLYDFSEQIFWNINTYRKNDMFIMFQCYLLNSMFYFSKTQSICYVCCARHIFCDKILWLSVFS